MDVRFATMLASSGPVSVRPRSWPARTARRAWMTAHKWLAAVDAITRCRPAISLRLRPCASYAVGVSRVSDRARWLHVSEVELLRMWGREVKRAFRGEMPYLVGSVLRRRDWRDVDVRVMLDNRVFDTLFGGRTDTDPPTILSLRELNLAFSLWGRQVTGLPIDFQVQRVNDANAEFDGPRDPIGISAEGLEASR